MIRKFKVQSAKCKILILFLALALLMLLQPAYAQPACPVQNPYPRVQQGLISTPIVVDPIFGNDIGKCVIDSKAAFSPLKLPSYNDLNSLYYTQAKSSSNVNKVTLEDNPNFGRFNSNMQSGNALFQVDGKLTVNNINFPTNATGKSAVIFVPGNLTVSENIAFGTGANSNAGLVFVVQGKVFIDKSVNTINAIIISSGIIYTAVDTANLNPTCSHTSPVSEISPGVPIQPLTINGSLISLDAGNPIEFCRKLAGVDNDTKAAEVIINQPKYLVILRDLFSDTLQKWTEIQ